MPDRHPIEIPVGAVFLSYASQDSKEAELICTALRAAGIEVWFNQSELRGGDAWDQSIRKQRMLRRPPAMHPKRENLKSTGGDVSTRTDFITGGIGTGVISKLYFRLFFDFSSKCR
jgi:hypothetical protein